MATRAELMRNLSKASANGVGNNIKDGRYRFAVKELGFKDGFKGVRFQAVLTVVSAIKKVGLASLQSNEKLDIEPNAVGSDVDWLAVKLDEKDSPGPGSIRKLIQTLMNKEMADDEYYETLHEACDLDKDGNALKVPLFPARGMLIDADTVRIETKKNKKEIIVVNWSNVPQESYDQEAYKTWLANVAAVAAAPKLPASAAA